MLGSGSGDDQFVMCHGSFALPLKLVDVLNQVTQFLASNPQEIGLFVTWYGSIGGHKSTKSLSGKRLN
jgi:hypothetical protein